MRCRPRVLTATDRSTCGSSEPRDQNRAAAIPGLDVRAGTRSERGHPPDAPGRLRGLAGVGRRPGGRDHTPTITALGFGAIPEDGGRKERLMDGFPVDW